ncbi:MAG TPA: hypothetical protein VH815_08725 [Acidobacteriota bacterium]|jgi:hypothetical protein
MNRIDLSKNVVYLAAPKRLFYTPLFDRAYRYLTKKAIGVLDPRGMYKSNQEWLATFEQKLSICDVMVVVSDNEIVGKGVYLEYNYFDDRYCKVYHYVETGGSVYLIPIKRMMVIDNDDWRDYATFEYQR